MATPPVSLRPTTPNQLATTNGHHADDVFSNESNLESGQSYKHRFSARFDLEPMDLSSSSSPSQLKRTIEAHLQETDRRLEDTQHLGTSLVRQREELARKLEEVEQFQHETQIPTDLRRRLVDIEKEHADVSREVARALIGPKTKQDEPQTVEPGVFTSQATGSPTKISAPNRRHRNQPSTRAGDLQFAADISTSLLAQVRQLQATVAEKDELVKRAEAEREANERDLQAYAQKIRSLDESEQKFKDENWNLETQRHELLNAARDATDKEKRLNASLNSALSEKNKLQNELDDLRMNHSKLNEEHTATRKAHDTEIHGFKRNADMADTDRQSLQDRIDELISQNQELAKAISTRSRSRQISPGEALLLPPEAAFERGDSPEDSPPPSPTKGTPRHGGLESETMRSSLHHAHRMIQNLKSNIHREKTEKIELRRMLQEARDEVESGRRDSSSAVKKTKAKPDNFKKPLRPDMLGSNRKSRTDVELTDDDWEDSNHDGVNTFQTSRPEGRTTDFSDAYQTANETESNFDTADERMMTESEAFMTGAESIAGDSTDELTETEDGASTSGRRVPVRGGRTKSSKLHANAGSSSDEHELQTPVQPAFNKFKLQSRSSYNRQFMQDATPESFRSSSVAADSPATVTQSPAVGEQSLFAELGGMDEINSDTHSTPARSSTMSSAQSTPGYQHTPSRSLRAPRDINSPAMKDSSTMTEPWIPESSGTTTSTPSKSLLPSALPIIAGVVSPARKHDDSSQYTPQRGLTDSPVRPTNSHITPPKTMWDEAHDSTPSGANMAYSEVLSQDSLPVQSPVNRTMELQRQLEHLHRQISGKESELDETRAGHAAALATAAAELELLRKTHETTIAGHTTATDALKSEHLKSLEDLQNKMQSLSADHEVKVKAKEAELDQLRTSHASSMSVVMGELHQSHKDRVAGFEKLQTTISELKNQHSSEIASKNSELESTRSQHTSALAAHALVLEQLKSAHADALSEKDKQLQHLNDTHSSAIGSKEAELADAVKAHATAMSSKNAEITSLLGQHEQVIAAKVAELDEVKVIHAAQMQEKDGAYQTMRGTHSTELSIRQAQLDDMMSKHTLDRDEHVKSMAAQKEEYLQLQRELDSTRNDHHLILAGKANDMEGLVKSHGQEMTRLKQEIESQANELTTRQSELEELRKLQDAELDKLRRQISSHNDELGSRQTEFSSLQALHATEIDGLRRQLTGQTSELSSKQEELDSLRTSHALALTEAQNGAAESLKSLNAKQVELDTARDSHSAESKRLTAEIATLGAVLASRKSEFDTLQAAHDKRIADSQSEATSHADMLKAMGLELDQLRKSHAQEKQGLKQQIASHVGNLHSKQAELDELKSAQVAEMDRISSQHNLIQQHLAEKTTELARVQTEYERTASSTSLAHAGELQILREQLSTHEQSLASKKAELQEATTRHAGEIQVLRDQLATQEQSLVIKGSEIDQVRSNHAVELEDLRAQISTYEHTLAGKGAELDLLKSQNGIQSQNLTSRITSLEQLIETLRVDHAKEIDKLTADLATRNEELEKFQLALERAEADKLKTPAYSGVLSQDSRPVEKQSSRSVSPERPRTAEKIIGGGALLGAAATIGYAAGHGNSTPHIQEDDTAAFVQSTSDSTVLRDTSANIDRSGRLNLKNDQSSQTSLTSDQLDRALTEKKRPLAPMVIPPRTRSPGSGPASPTRYPGHSPSRNRDFAPILEDGNAVSTPARPSSASSFRTSSLVSQQHPPLPVDHQDVIARANSQIGSPTKNNTSRQSGTMGPPLLPASAMRRPKTPNESVRTASRISSRNRRNTAGSPTSRRSSVSSFASELDDRFNIRTEGQRGPAGFEAGPGTDPRMIQAITQTMIGEYLWKYTRKAGGKEMSTTRHRRYFWVHPYTRTLYWSEHDPQTAGRSELKAKSVKIESVRVVSDDNPMPPGLHRKSLEVITPGRVVKFTASTGQRHETWFNALSYLLHRGDGVEPVIEADGTDITREDIAEFNVNGYGARLVPHDGRLSMSSYNSRTTSGTTRRVGRPAMQTSTVGSTASHTPQLATVNQDTSRQGRLEAPTTDKDRTIRANSITRISKMFGSMTNRTKSEQAESSDRPGQKRENSSIYNASIVSDHRNDIETTKQDERPGLEDVRACCDGKHHVGSLHRHASSQSTSNRFSNAINRSMSRRA